MLVSRNTTRHSQVPAAFSRDEKPGRGLHRSARSMSVVKARISPRSSALISARSLVLTSTMVVAAEQAVLSIPVIPAWLHPIFSIRHATFNFLSLERPFSLLLLLLLYRVVLYITIVNIISLGSVSYVFPPHFQTPK